MAPSPPAAAVTSVLQTHKDPCKGPSRRPKQPLDHPFVLLYQDRHPDAKGHARGSEAHRGAEPRVSCQAPLLAAKSNLPISYHVIHLYTTARLSFFASFLLTLQRLPPCSSMFHKLPQIHYLHPKESPKCPAVVGSLGRVSYRRADGVEGGPSLPLR